MVYTLVNISRDKNNRVKNYIIKDIASGINYTVSRLQVLELFKRGDKFRGLKLSKDNKILIGNGIVIQSEAPINIKGIGVVTGNGLYTKIARADGYIHRNNVEKVIYSISNNKDRNVITLHGIRRTGKTTAIMHTISELLKSGIDETRIVYMEIYTTEVNIWDLHKYLNQFKNKIIFIDEITKVKDFVTSASYFSDSLTDTNTVILTGTDSYAFNTAMIDSLHDRYIDIKFTSLSYTEYLKLFNSELKIMTDTDKLNSFKLYGGVLSKREYGNPIQAYVSIQNAIVENIINTVMRNSTYKSTPEHTSFIAKYDIKILVYVVIRSILNVCSISNEFGTGVLKNINLNKEAYNFIGETTTSILEYIDGEIGINEEAFEYKSVTLKLIKSMLLALADLKVVSGIRNITNRIQAETSKYYDSTKLRAEIICLIPSLLFCILNKMNKRLKDTVDYRDYDINSEINGIITENLVISQCIIAEYDVNFLRYELNKAGLDYYNETNSTPEIDCIITNKDSGTKNIPKRVLIEVKHSTQPKSEHAKNLRLKSVEDIVGANSKKIVVYMGETTVVQGIQYINIHNFLTDIPRWVEQW